MGSMALVSLINADRLGTRLMALAEIDATPAGGLNRQTLSDGDRHTPAASFTVTSGDDNAFRFDLARRSGD
jgi:hypothetical protein